MKFINSTLEKPEHDSNETSTSVKSNFTINGNMTAAHDGRLGNMNGSWCASGSPLDSEYLIVDLGITIYFIFLICHCNLELYNLVCIMFLPKLSTRGKIHLALNIPRIFC